MEKYLGIFIIAVALLIAAIALSMAMTCENNSAINIMEVISFE